MGFEFPVDSDYFQHPKTKLLVGLAGPCADVFPLRLWAWCSKYARTGYVKGGREQIEAAVDWQGEPGKLHKALMKSGFVEKDGKTVHDFMEHTGRQILLYENKKLRQREKYAAQVGGNSSGRKQQNSGYPEDPENPGENTAPPKKETNTEKRVREAEERNGKH